MKKTNYPWGRTTVPSLLFYLPLSIFQIYLFEIIMPILSCCSEILIKGKKATQKTIPKKPQTLTKSDQFLLLHMLITQRLLRVHSEKSGTGMKVKTSSSVLPHVSTIDEMYETGSLQAGWHLVNDFYSYECQNFNSIGEVILHKGNRKSLSIFFNSSSFFGQPELKNGLYSVEVPKPKLFLFSTIPHKKAPEC